MAAKRKQEYDRAESEGMGAVFWVVIACLLSVFLVFSLVICTR